MIVLAFAHITAYPASAGTALAKCAHELKVAQVMG